MSKYHKLMCKRLTDIPCAQHWHTIVYCTNYRESVMHFITLEVLTSFYDNELGIPIWDIQ